MSGVVTPAELNGDYVANGTHLGNTMYTKRGNERCNIYAHGSGNGWYLSARGTADAAFGVRTSSVTPPESGWGTGNPGSMIGSTLANAGTGADALDVRRRRSRAAARASAST